MVVCVVIEGYFDVVTPEILSEFTVKSALIRDELERLLPSPSLVHNVSHNIIGIAVFIDSDENDVETRQPVGQTVQLLSSRLRAVQDVRCTVSVGGVADGLTHISAEVERAIQRAEHVEPGAFVATSGAEGNGRNGYYYPAETELRLIRTVRAGQADEAREIARELETENLAHRSLSRESIRRLYQEIDATRLKIERRRYNGDGSSFDPDCTASADDRIRYLLDYLVNAADHAAASGPVGSRLKGPIERFVRENALNPEMGLKLLAMHFNLSEVYVSRLFRDSFGENFHSYVESIRMDHATRLLRTTALNVEEIAERVGYQSANTFRRVFKRRFGVSPSAYDAGG
jgi:AraC-like DNA-binding protein